MLNIIAELPHLKNNENQLTEQGSLSHISMIFPIDFFFIAEKQKRKQVITPSRYEMLHHHCITKLLKCIYMKGR